MSLPRQDRDNMAEGLVRRLWMVAAGLGEEGIFAYEIQKGPAEGALQGGQDICF